MADAAKNQQQQQPAEAARLVKPITTDRVTQIDQSRAKYEVIIPAGVDPDDVLPVAYWSHLAGTFKAAKDRGYRVDLTVLTEDEKWEAEMRVLDAGANWARVAFKTTEDGKRCITKLGGIQHQKIVQVPGHTVNFAGIFGKWRVVRDADGAVLRDKFNTEVDAYYWLADHAKQIQS